MPFWRVHRPALFGDKIGKMRPDIVDANKEQRQNAGYTVAIHGLQYRLVQPVSYEGQHVGIIPICSKCHKIRDDEGYWHQVESYITKHSDAVFSHGMCLQCADELYGGQGWYEDAKKAGKI